MADATDTAEAIGWKRLAKGARSDGVSGVYVILWHRSLEVKVMAKGPNYRTATERASKAAIARSQELEAVKSDLCAMLDNRP